MIKNADGSVLLSKADVASRQAHAVARDAELVALADTIKTYEEKVASLTQLTKLQDASIRTAMPVMNDLCDRIAVLTQRNATQARSIEQLTSKARGETSAPEAAAQAPKTGPKAPGQPASLDRLFGWNQPPKAKQAEAGAKIEGGAYRDFEADAKAEVKQEPKLLLCDCPTCESLRAADMDRQIIKRIEAAIPGIKVKVIR